MHKFKLKATALTAALMIISSTPAGAELIGMQYNALSGRITVKGQSQGIMSLTVLPGALDGYDEAVKPVAFDTVPVSGDWRYSFKLADSCESGDYTVFVSDADSKNEYAVFKYTAPGTDEASAAASAQIDSLYARIKQATPDDAWNILYVNDDILGVPQSLFEDMRITDSIKNEMMRLFSGMSNPKGEVEGQGGFEAFADKLKLMAAIRTAGNVTVLREAVTNTFAHESKPILDACINYSSKTSLKTFENLWDTRNQITVTGDLQKVFDAAADKAAKAMNDGGGSGSGGSGGSGSGSGNGSVTIPSVQTPVDSEQRFIDLPKSHWAYTAVEEMAEKGIVSGYTDGSFSPTASITRAEFATMAVKAFGLSGGDGGFSDVAADAWYRAYVDAAAAAGIVSGYDGKFMPQENILRQDAAVIIYRALGLESMEGTEFSDNSAISDYAKEAVSTLNAVGVLKGSDGYFYPKNTITRAEAAQMIYMALQK